MIISLLFDGCTFHVSAGLWKSLQKKKKSDGLREFERWRWMEAKGVL
jgi:hypothetical protein